MRKKLFWSLTIRPDDFEHEILTQSYLCLIWWVIFLNLGASRKISPAVRFHVKTGPSMSSIDSGSNPLSRTRNKVSSWSFLYSSSQSFSSALTKVRYRNLVGLEIVSSLSQIIFIWLPFDLDFFKTQTVLIFASI